MLGRPEPHFSFAGLKTALRRQAQAFAPLSERDVADLCAEFQLSVCESVADRVRRASAEDRGWLCSVIDREGQRFGTRTQLLPDQRIELRWPAEDSVADPSPRPETE